MAGTQSVPLQASGPENSDLGSVRRLRARETTTSYSSNVNLVPLEGLFEVVPDQRR